MFALLRRRSGRLAAPALLAAAALWAPAGAAGAPQPPDQPAFGPGGSVQPWGGVEEIASRGTAPADSYWIFKPAGWQGKPGERPTTLPVTVFLHGYDPVRFGDPQADRAWLTQLTRSGSYVIFPKYQGQGTARYQSGAVAAIGHAIADLESEAIVPDLTGLHYVGYSLGGTLAANIAATTTFAPARTIVFAAPSPGVDGVPLSGSLAGIPPTARLACMVFSDDGPEPGRKGCDLIWDKTRHIALRQYDYLYSDAYRRFLGRPLIIADHLAPSSIGVDTLDWNGTWKISIATRTCAQSGDYCDYVAGGPQQTSMGNWNDGTPVCPLHVAARGTARRPAVFPTMNRDPIPACAPKADQPPATGT